MHTFNSPFFLLFDQESPYCLFVLSPTDYVACPAEESSSILFLLSHKRCDSCLGNISYAFMGSLRVTGNFYFPITPGGPAKQVTSGCSLQL